MTDARRFRDGNGRYAPDTQIGAEGRRSHKECLADWINLMAEWTEEQLLAVVQNGNKNEPAVKREAARLVLSAAGLNDTETADEDLDRCCDLTGGTIDDDLP